MGKRGREHFVFRRSQSTEVCDDILSTPAPSAPATATTSTIASCPVGTILSCTVVLPKFVLFS